MNHLVIPHLIPGGVVHHEVDEAVDGVHDEGDGPQPDAGGGPLPAGLRHVGDRLGHASQRVGADPVNGEACGGFFVRDDIIFFRDNFSPGTITEARACHTRVSNAARATFPVFESFS